MDSKVITHAIDAQDWLEPVAETLQKGVGDAYAAGGPAGEKVADFLHGVWLGHALHPVLTDVPIGAWTTAAILDILEASGRKDLASGADAAVGVGLIGALGAALSGLTDWYPLHSRTVRRVGATHALLNVTATLLYGTSWLLRRRGARGAGKALSWLGYGIVNASAYLGGTLVYEQKLGVDHATRAGLPQDWVAVLADSELPADRLRRVDADGIPVLLVRQGGQIHAIGEVCSHMGGPLAEGTLEDGVVVCPWHGSRFCLADGQVQGGPATVPQPCFEARVQNGQIEVRAPAVPQNEA